MGGLKEDIRAPLALHRPQNLDTASALALLQEEVLEVVRRQSSAKDLGKTGNRVFTTSDRGKQNSKNEKQSNNEKWAEIKAYRKAHDLCYTCGEKWTGRGHKCPDKVPIHVIQELLEMFQLDNSPDHDASDCDDSEEIIMAMQDVQPDQNTKKKRRTMRFRGFIGKQEILILLDSGSAGTFVNDTVASSLTLQPQPCDTIQFTTADGSPMSSTRMIPQMQWFIQGHTFSYDTRILPLKCYDMILGADWLEDHSPTWIHWQKKIVRFPHLGRRI